MTTFSKYTDKIREKLRDIKAGDAESAVAVGGNMEQFTSTQFHEPLRQESQYLSRDFLDQRRARRREQRSQERRRLAIATLATAAVGLFGAAWFGFGRSSFANAQGFSEEDISQYAEAVLAIEALRQTAHSQTKALVGGAVPVVICSKEDTVKTLSPEVRRVAVTFCNEAKSIIESTGLGVEQFNRMVEIQLIDPNLSQRVQEELVRLQQPR
ncbi:MAG: DUF4168 domain-containing protein [Cyanobacteria bacterium P01_D01_bin.73]